MTLLKLCCYLVKAGDKVIITEMMSDSGIYNLDTKTDSPRTLLGSRLKINENGAQGWNQPDPRPGSALGTDTRIFSQTYIFPT
jgi:hypothetical protein